MREKNSELLQEIQTNELRLKELETKIKPYSDLHEVVKEKEKVEVIKNYISTENEKLKIENKNIGDLINHQLEMIGKPEITKQLVEFKTLQILLNGISPDSSQSSLKPAQLQKYSGEVAGESRKSYVRHLMQTLEGTVGRRYSYDETANLLLCTMQSYVTVLTGPPGTGKTSTVNRLASALGMESISKGDFEINNFLTIPIGRGWMSSRDLLGFFNSLKNTYQPSRSGLYQFLEAFSEGNYKAENAEYLKMVLMDEANLSSIEHYWSDFLGKCDSLEMDHEIDLGVSGKGERYLKIPKSLRFFCTINNDATVETLSNRFIDRAAIISLGNGEEASPANIQEGIQSGAVPYIELMKGFYPQGNEEELEDREHARLKSILDILSTGSSRGAQINMSPRKRNAITRYCYIANQLGYEKNEPLDYAVSQHILPLISGHGQGFRSRLQDLGAKLDEFKFSVSRKIVSNIILTGDDFSDSYSFF